MKIKKISEQRYLETGDVDCMVVFSGMEMPLDWPPESPDNQYHLFK